MDALLTALQFLTRIPLPFTYGYSDKALGRSPLFYPLVGLFLGGILAGLAALLQSAPTTLTAALLLTAWALLSGGLHLDGLADCADAWIGGHGDRQRSLRIMKDPACGPIAVTVLVLLLLLKWAALTALLAERQWLAIALTPLLGRAGILVLMLTTTYVSPQGLASTMLQHFPSATAGRVLALVVISLLPTLGWPSLLAVGLTLWAIRSMAMQRLGGVTGDVYGAAVELSEAAALLAVAI